MGIVAPIARTVLGVPPVLHKKTWSFDDADDTAFNTTPVFGAPDRRPNPTTQPVQHENLAIIDAWSDRMKGTSTKRDKVVTDTVVAVARQSSSRAYSQRCRPILVRHTGEPNRLND